MLILMNINKFMVYVILRYVKLPQGRMKKPDSKTPHLENVVHWVWRLSRNLNFNIYPGLLWCESSGKTWAILWILSKYEKELGKWNKLNSVLFQGLLFPHFCSRELFCSSAGTLQLMEIWVWEQLQLVKERPHHWFPW